MAANKNTPKKTTTRTRKKPASTTKVEPKSGRNEKGHFAKGNKIWQMWDGKDGNPKKFKTPEDLWNAAIEYFNYCDENPINTIDFKGKDANEVIIPKMRAYTWQGLELFIGVESLREYKTTYSEFSQVVTRIGKIIYTQKFEGAAAGVLNANIIARDLGLREQTHMTLDDDRKKAADLFPDELDEEND